MPSRPRCSNACGDRGRAGGIISCFPIPRELISDLCCSPQRELRAGEGQAAKLTWSSSVFLLGGQSSLDPRLTHLTRSLGVLESSGVEGFEA